MKCSEHQVEEYLEKAKNIMKKTEENLSAIVKSQKTRWFFGNIYKTSAQVLYR